MKPYAHHVLVVADRDADPTPLIDAVREQARAARIEATVVVPDTLNARRHATVLQVSLLNAGVAICDAHVGDADARTAIDEALAAEHFDEVLVNVRSQPVLHCLPAAVTNVADLGRAA